jgi:hypothetical protein
MLVTIYLQALESHSLYSDICDLARLLLSADHTRELQEEDYIYSSQTFLNLHLAIT